MSSKEPRETQPETQSGESSSEPPQSRARAKPQEAIPPPALEAILKVLPPDLRALIEQARPAETEITVETLISLIAYRGPFPPAEILEEYERRFPGSAGRLLDWTERQIEHRKALEREQTSGTERRMDRAQTFGFVTAVTGILAAATIAIVGHSIGAYTVAAVIALVSVGGPTFAQLLAKQLWRPSSERK